MATESSIFRNCWPHLHSCRKDPPGTRRRSDAWRPWGSLSSCRRNTDLAKKRWQAGLEREDTSAGHGLTCGPAALHRSWWASKGLLGKADAAPRRKLVQCKRWLLHSQDYFLVLLQCACLVMERLGNICSLSSLMEGSVAQPVRTALPCNVDLCLWGCRWSPLCLGTRRRSVVLCTGAPWVGLLSLCAMTDELDHKMKCRVPTICLDSQGIFHLT